MSNLPIIKWQEALEQTGNDAEFLKEVLDDLILEADEAQEAMAGCISIGNFEGIKTAAHKIKGSASYLCCEALREVSLLLQDLGHAGMNAQESAQKQLMNTVIEKFNLYKKHLIDLKLEISKGIVC
mmetsp:Transcript_33283/g.48167  ORF Transcript_33283/g.48167 Transcript_33283/m.48167 type:complete len:126 (+) Transcript_33283:58-435(+)|eukprot:CAMPEP_0170074830 /NCGR_PEP_ID=MMETSP0019_2-20121128/12071_1 /TAXON_ID=98059 /ORGANISM="Dinobryon sp., Strain UTEXLB2267" /LENGTH=125 /DNA_ID=CAMNT_0010285399 /DNA_START=147 /DNA_END=524 /DNA_ORIENTATION=-